MFNYSKQIYWLRESEKKDKDYWKRKNVIVLGPYDYRELYNPYVDDSRVLTIPLPNPKKTVSQIDPVNMLISASTGVGKTRLVKRIVYYYWLNGYKILVFEPKSVEFINARFPGKGRRLHFYESNTTFPIYSYVPSYCRRGLEKDGYPVDKLNFFKFDVSSFTDFEFWLSLGFTERAAQYISASVNKGNFNLDKIADSFYMSNPATRAHAERYFVMLDQFDFFCRHDPSLDIKKHWDRNEMVCINFYMDDLFMDTVIGKVTDMVAQIGREERKRGERHVTKKLIVFDDSMMYAKSDSSKMNLASKSIKRSQNMLRALGVSSIIIIQNPKMIDTSIVDGTDIKIISFQNNYSVFEDIIPKPALKYLKGNDEEEGGLLQIPEKYIREWLISRGINDWSVFSPYDVMVGH